MTLDNTALPGIALTVVTVLLLLAALIAGETAARGRAHRLLTVGATAAAAACLSLVALRFAAVL